MKKYCYFFILANIYSALYSTIAFAEFKRAHSMLTKVQTSLTMLSLISVTIAILWVGYKVLYGGSTIRECAPIVIGAILLASAAEIAKILVG